MKKIITVVFSVSLCVVLAFNAFAAWCGYGDVNCDKKINSADALEVLKHSTGIISLSSDQKTAADVNGDGKINSLDALMILNFSVGNIDVFPVEEGGDPDIDHGVIDD